MPSKHSREELESRIRILENEAKQYQHKIETLKKSEVYLQAILNNTNLPIYLKDDDYKYIFVNRQYEKLAHVTLDEIRGKEDYDIFPLPVAEMFRSQDEEVRKCKELLEFTETVPLPDGERTFITAKFPLYGTAGNLYALGGVCTDITKLKRAEAESNRLAAVIRQSRELVNLTNPDGRMVFLNDAGQKMLGISEEDIAQTSIMKVIPEHLQEKVRQEVLPSVLQNGYWEGDLQFLNLKTGKLTDVHARYFGIADMESGSLELIANVSLDITEQKRAEKEKARIEAQFHQAQKMESVGRLAGGRSTRLQQHAEPNPWG